MSWAKINDHLSMSVKIQGLADPGATGAEAKRQRGEALGHWLQILTWVAAERTDGFVTTRTVDEYCTEASRARLTRPVMGRAPLLHARAEDGKTPTCRCVQGRSWPDDADYAVHDYLDYNPTRTENDVHKAKARELRNAKLKRAVRDRDRDRCRYCGKPCKFTDRVSDDGLTFDHVDPEIADGMNNLVVACRGCNRRKGRRTPEQANMALIDLDLPTTGPATGPATVTSPDADPSQVSSQVQDTALSQDLQQVTASSQNQRSPEGDGTGTAAGTQRIRSSDTPRTPGVNESPYLRPQRPSPDNHAGHPPEGGTQ